MWVTTLRLLAGVDVRRYLIASFVCGDYPDVAESGPTSAGSLSSVWRASNLCTLSLSLFPGMFFGTARSRQGPGVVSRGVANLDGENRCERVWQEGKARHAKDTGFAYTAKPENNLARRGEYCSLLQAFAVVADYSAATQGGRLLSTNDQQVPAESTAATAAA
jgi:hypothetical protein